MTPVTAVIADDEPLARRTLRGFLARVEWLRVLGEAEDGESAVRMVDELRPDLLFLDVQMPEASGMEVLQRRRHIPAVGFTTAYDEYAVAAFELGAVDYLRKPFGRERLFAALERVRGVVGTRQESPSAAERARWVLGADGPLRRLFVRDRGRILPLRAEEIERLEGEDDYVAVHAGGHRYLVYITLGEFEARLDPERFLRVHRSHIVNLDFVRALVPYDATRLMVEMRDGTSLVASRAGTRVLRGLVA